LNILSKK